MWKNIYILKVQQVVCQYFLKGQCRFGDSCRNEHPANARQSGSGGNLHLTAATMTSTKAQIIAALTSHNESILLNIINDNPTWSTINDLVYSFMEVTNPIQQMW